MPSILTIGLSSWAVDLEGIGAVYPFQGTEGLLVLLGIVYWIGFHVLQIRQERKEWIHHMAAEIEVEHARQAIERY